MSNRLEGKVALVTACTRGIGRAIARRFVSDGGKIVIGFDDDKDIERFIERFAKRS
mgnify:FL=1